ncbi:MAG: hypothetical protein IT480_01125 [Gammaproteobacteria bacterium]|nr:hypothetical protein [Gammaproteobacteria bacterium]
MLATGPTRLPAEPAALSTGPAGPFNRMAFELHAAGPPGPPPQVVCIYPGGVRYRCDVVPLAAASTARRQRIAVVIPDLGRGSKITLQFVSARGRQDVPVDLANVSQVVHEIEVLPMPGSGVSRQPGSSRTAVPPVTARIVTTPAMATSTLASAPTCDQVHAEWVSASATDPVFASPRGSVKGVISLARTVTPGSAVRPDNVPEWLVTYTPTATRLQFIAHYEVIYRVGMCPQRIIAG